ncbi:hypothetical protein, partial [Telmatospirillum sp. J64-1]|uniref:hypothetical protein n=1 Tax=Telmatospirillum sp. J64-1 TaxID=2502183 RepID=UPI00115E93AB
MARKTLYICQPYLLEMGKTEKLKPGVAITPSTKDAALRRADRLLEMQGIVGVDVVEQTADDVLGEYDEPIY